jgi:hypothetical protein
MIVIRHLFLLLLMMGLTACGGVAYTIQQNAPEDAEYWLVKESGTIDAAALRMVKRITTDNEGIKVYTRHVKLFKKVVKTSAKPDGRDERALNAKNNDTDAFMHVVHLERGFQSVPMVGSYNIYRMQFTITDLKGRRVYENTAMVKAKIRPMASGGTQAPADMADRVMAMITDDIKKGRAQ